MYYFTKEYIWPRDLIAGTIACAVSNTLSAPLERLKFQIQLKGSKKNAVVTALKDVIKNGGTRSLWAGNGANLLKLVPQSAIRLIMFRNILDNISEERNSLSAFISGAVAGLTSQMIMYPVEVLRIRMTVAKPGQFNGILHAIKHLYKTGGKQIFYRGFLLSSMLSIPYFGTKFVLMDLILREFPEETVVRRRKTVSILAVGIASTVAMLIVYPGFVIRTILQTSSSLKAKSVLVYTLKKRGIRGLYSGVSVSGLRIFDVAGINFLVFTEINDLLKELGL